MTVPRLLLGNYGEGTFGIKTSTPGHDVTVLADDNNVLKRSFNSEWTNLCKIKLIGVATTPWFQYQAQVYGYDPYAGRTTMSAQSGWRTNTTTQVPTGLSYIPIWEDRCYETSTKTFYDDDLRAFDNGSSYSGARSYFSGPTMTPANTLTFTPWRSNLRSLDVYNENSRYPGPVNDQWFPAYPAYPPMPTHAPAIVYVVYANKIGDVS